MSIDSRTQIIKYADSSYYKEYDATLEEKAYVDKIIKENYGMFLYKNDE